MSLEGRLGDLGLPDIFQTISLSKRSGILTLIKKDGTGRVVFNQGNVVYASSDNKSRFGYTLLHKGLIRQRDLDRALTFQKARTTKIPIGTILVEIGAISRDDLEVQLRGHIVDVIRDLLTWNTGSFHFTLTTFTDESALMRNGISPEFLLLEGARLDDEAAQGPAVSAAAIRSAASVAVDGLEETPDDSMGSRELLSDGMSELAGVDSRDHNVGKDLTLLPAMLDELSASVSEQEILLLVLRFASELMNRSVMCLVTESRIVGWGQFGVTVAQESADQRVRSIALPLAQLPLCRDLVRSKRVFKGRWPDTAGDRHWIDRLGGGWPAESFLAPVVSHHRVVALLYGDNLPSDRPVGATRGLEAFTRMGGNTLSWIRLSHPAPRAASGGP